ncbi:MAG: translation initiation factor IF-2, partial [Candidatus Promineifilaceae bacterium]
MAETKTLIEVPDFITVRQLAETMEVSPIEVIKQLMNNGIMANINQQIDFDTAAIVAEEMGYEATPVVVEVEAEEEAAERPAWKQILAGEAEANLEPRPPVITMLGHVDHGKTTLLDVIRHTNVQAGEAGGITQHIGAYQVSHDGRPITFLDTPGHEAFTAMRARGAQATDIAVLVIAADDGVMPQTREAIDHARAAGVPIVVALNKIDLPSANPNKVMQQLAEVGLTPDEWEGDTLVIPVSGRRREGIDDLLEAISLVAEEIGPRANPKASPSGTVLDAHMERGQGATSTLLVQNGTLRLGDTLVAGQHYGRIKAMFDYTGKRLKAAGPGTPVSASGLDGLPDAGQQFRVVENEREARRIVEQARQRQAQPEDRRAPISLDEFFNRLQEGESKSLNIILKADVVGSLEPLVNSLNNLKVEATEEVELDILRAATGAISENDVMLAAASDAVVLGFNAEVDPAARAAAGNEGVEIKTYSVIYNLLEDVEKAMKGLLGPSYEEVIIGRAEVRATFKLRNAGVVAGSYMRTGEARRNAQARVIRDTQLLFTGPVASLRHLQDNVREVRTGFEFGVTLEGW